MKTIGQIIREKRKEKKWNLKELAEKIDVNCSTVSNWERGAFIPNAIYCIALAQVFECSIDELCGVKEIAKDLCEKSGCHHKCNDTKDCVVEDEALLLINENKSNNFDVKSNEELFKQALVEGLNRRFDREIEEAKKIEQIEEMAKAVCVNCMDEVCASGRCAFQWDCPLSMETIKKLYTAGYRKQSEWISVEDRLPTEGQNVLCYENGNYYIAFYENMDNVISWWDWVDFDRDNTWNEVFPTHWMPLPEAPKMKGGEE